MIVGQEVTGTNPMGVKHQPNWWYNWDIVWMTLITMTSMLVA